MRQFSKQLLYFVKICNICFFVYNFTISLKFLQTYVDESKWLESQAVERCFDSYKIAAYR